MFGKMRSAFADTARTWLRVIVIIAVVAAMTGAVSADIIRRPDMSAVSVSGLSVMIISVIIVLMAPLLVKKVPDERKDSAIMLFKLGGVLLCAVGAIMVFCG